MPSFMRRFKHSQNLNVKDTPSLVDSPSTFSSTSQSSLSISLRQRMTSIVSKLYFRGPWGRPSSKGAISHLSTVPWPQSPQSPTSTSPSSDIRLPSGLGRRHSNISESCTDSPDSPSFPRMSEMFPRVPTHIVPPSVRSSFQTRPTHARSHTQSSPAVSHHLTDPAPPPAQQLGIVSPVQSYERRSPWITRQRKHQIPLSLIFAHVSRSQLPVLARVSKRFNAAAQLALYRTLDLSAADADACIARLAGAPHLAALVTSLALRAYPRAHGASFILALALALHSMSALTALTLPAFDAELLAAVPVTVTRLTLLADKLPYAFFDDMPASAHLTDLPNFVGVPPYAFFDNSPARARLTHLPPSAGALPSAHDVPSTAAPRLAVLDGSPDPPATHVPGRALRRVTLRITSTLYDGLRPAALFGALGGKLEELVLVLASDVDVRTRGRLLGALANTGAGLELLELNLEGTSDEVSLQALYKQVGSLLPNLQALHTLHLRTTLPSEAAKAEEGPSCLALLTLHPLGSALRCVVFPSGAQWELEEEEWICVN